MSLQTLHLLWLWEYLYPMALSRAWMPLEVCNFIAELKILGCFVANAF